MQIDLGNLGEIVPRDLRKLLACIVVALTIMLLPVVPASATESRSAAPAYATTTNEFRAQAPIVSIRNRNSHLCLVGRYGLESGLQQTSCDSRYSDQRWWLQLYDGYNTVQFQNERWNLCLVARGPSENWAKITGCDVERADQLWRIETWAHVDYVRIVNKNSGLCLAAKGSTGEAFQARCGNFADQFWYFH